MKQVTIVQQESPDKLLEGKENHRAYETKVSDHDFVKLSFAIIINLLAPFIDIGILKKFIFLMCCVVPQNYIKIACKLNLSNQLI